MHFRTHLIAGDIGEIVRLHGVTYARECGWDYTFEAYVAESLARFGLHHDSESERIWLLDADERVAGSIGIVAATQASAQLRWFLLKPEFRGRGFGRALLHEAVTFARTANYESVFLWTVRELEAANRLYRRAGFALVEEKANHRWSSDVIEEKYELVLR